MVAWRHPGKERHLADPQLTSILALGLERRFLQPKDEYNCIDKSGRKVLDEIEAMLVEQMNLVVAMSIRSRWRRLNDSDRRFKYRSVFGRQDRSLDEPTVEQQPVERNIGGHGSHRTSCRCQGG
jgi:hypothetical protein